MPSVVRPAVFAVLVAVSAAGAQQSDTARANDSVRTFDPVVVTAARRDERRSTAMIATAVISRQQIRDAAATDVAAVLSQQLGLQVGGGSPAGTQVLIQGLGDQRVLVLLDGQPVVGRVGGTLDLSRLPAAIVERIEVVKGPQSLMYGTDAMGGVINIITRRPGAGMGSRQRIAPEASIIAGSHGRLDVSTHIGGNASSDVGYGIDVARNHVDLAPGVPSENGAFANRWNVAPRLAWRPRSNLSFDVGGLGVSESQRYRTGQLYTFSDNTQIDGRVGAVWTRGMTRVVPTIAYSSFEHLSRAAIASRPASDSGARDEQRLFIGTVNVSSMLGGLLVDAGTELRHETIRADRVPGARGTDAAAVFAQATWIGGRVSIAPGARASWSEQWGNSVTPRVALIAKPLGEASPLTARASVSRGWRAPDFKELYLRFVNSAAGYAVDGNANLHPERSTNTTAELEWTTRAGDLRVSGFRNQISNLIETVGPDARGTYTYDNVGRATTAGFEVEATRWWSRAELGGGYAYLNARDISTGSAILGRAAHSGRARLRTDVGRGARLTLTAVYTGDAPSSRDDLGAIDAERGAYTQVNVRLARAVTVRGLPSVEIAIGADDVFDAQRGLEWPGFTGRRLLGSVSWPARP